MNNPQSEMPEFDPLVFWKQFQTAGMNAWTKAMNETVASEEFAKIMGQYLAAYLEAAPFQQQLIEPVVGQYLQQANLPSRPDLLRLAERLTHLEITVDDLDAKIDEVLDRLQAIRETLALSPVAGDGNGPNAHPA